MPGDDDIFLVSGWCLPIAMLKWTGTENEQNKDEDRCEANMEQKDKNTIIMAQSKSSRILDQKVFS